MMNSLKNPALYCAHLIKDSSAIAVFSGAGISTNAGIPDFRGPQGLYVTKRYDPDKVFDINAFYQNPDPFFEFARDFINLKKKLKPTFTHKFLATLERKGKVKGIITQNIDSLHQLSGSKNVLEIHGSFWRNFCCDCRKEYSYKQIKKKLEIELLARCKCGGIIKPDIVFFGENVKRLNEAADLASQVDLFFIIGTSCVVYPAAMLPQYVSGKVVVINKNPIAINLHNIVLNINEDVDQFFRKVANYV